jgi:perosamine synthetase
MVNSSKENIKHTKMTIPIYKPYLPKTSLKYAHDALKSSWISNIGEYKELSKKTLISILSCKNVLLTNNGTTATHLIYKSLKHKNPRIKNIIVPVNVYVAAWNSMLFDNDKINFIPVRTNLNSWNVDIDDLLYEANLYDPKDTAILIVHNIGGIVNVPFLKRKLPEYDFIEDNCEGFLGKYENKFSGTECLASSVSFYGNKTITCGEGGAVFTNSESQIKYLEKIHSQGQTETRYIHDEIGYNFRMTNVQAAILYGQLKIYETILQKKKKIFERYKINLEKNNNIIFQFQEEKCENALWMFAIRIKNKKLNYKLTSEYFLSRKIETRNIFFPMSYHQHLKSYSNINKEIEAETLLNEIVILPSSPSVTFNEIDYISNEILKFCENDNNLLR